MMSPHMLAPDHDTMRRLRSAARHAADRTVLSLVNLAVYYGDATAKPVMGTAPRETVFTRGKLSVHRLQGPASDEYELGNAVHPIEAARIPVPVLVIPPLMVRPYVYDLRPEHSMLRTMRNAGLDVFVVDFGVPDRSDENVSLDDYVLDYVPTAIDQTLRASGAQQLAVVGYCMGGIFGLLHVGTWQDERVRALVTIGSPVNFDKMGIVTLAARLGAPSIDHIIDAIGNVPGSLSSLAFKLISGHRTITRYADLAANLHDEDYVRAFNAINTWVNDMIPYPKEAFRQMFKEVVHGNKLLTNQLVFGDRPCDLRNIRCPLLAFAGESDSVATPSSTREIVDLVASTDKRFVSVPGGHVAVVAGGHAPELVWAPTVNWLCDRLGTHAEPASSGAMSTQRPPAPSTSSAQPHGARAGNKPGAARSARAASRAPRATPPSDRRANQRKRSAR